MRARTIVTLVILGASTPARANFRSQPMLPIGESASRMGGAATAWVNDGSSTWYNPAGLGSARRQGISASVNAYGVQRVRVADYVDLGGEDRGDLESSTIALFPSYLGYVKPFEGSGGFRHGIGVAIVVPDFEKVDAVFDIPPREFALELHARLRALNQTIWTMPGWGACLSNGRLCFGVALALGYRSESETTVFDQEIVVTDESWFEETTSQLRDLWVGLVGGSAGVAWQAARPLRLGLSVRTPVRSVAGGGTLLHENAQVDTLDPDDPVAFVRRAEDKDLTVSYRLPLQLRVGAALNLDRWQFAADVVASTAQSSFAFVRGDKGEETLQPLDTLDFPEGEPVPIAADLERNAIVDFAVGVRWAATDKWAILAGGFTNLSGADEDVDDLYGDRAGGTVGLSMTSERSTTHLGVTVIRGFGQITGVALDEAGNVTNPAIDTDFLATYLAIGGTADF